MKVKSIIAVIAEDKRSTQVKKPSAGVLAGALGLKEGLLGGSTELKSENPNRMHLPSETSEPGTEDDEGHDCNFWWLLTQGGVRQDPSLYC